MAADIPINNYVISFYDFLQLYIYIGFIDGLRSIAIKKNELVGVGHHHSVFYPFDYLFQIIIDFNPPGLISLLFLDG